MATILVVDDDREVADVLRLGLEQHGDDVALAYDGTTALSLLQNRAFDALILDVRMPGLDGLAVIRRIRAQPRLFRLRIMVLSAEEAGGEAQRALVAGADAFHLKPFRVLELVEQIQMLVQAAP
jgi:CheY-like chemotaxis protein